ncbi:MAG: hypothetical protein LBT76_01475, partial [Tannerella sp.]|nr:hypothetical protein [Tannerella sp.]
GQFGLITSIILSSTQVLFNNTGALLPALFNSTPVLSQSAHVFFNNTDVLAHKKRRKTRSGTSAFQYLQ